MRFRERDDDDLQINLTPLIDVVFLLLIFFMVSTTFTKESKLQIQLPESSETEQTNNEDKFVEIEISQLGEITINGPGLERQHHVADISSDAMQSLMRQAAADIKDPNILVRADKDSRHEVVIQIMDVVRRSGYSRISFATEINAESP